MFCQECGNPMKDGARFCVRCGTAVVPTESSPVSGTLEAAPQSHTHKSIPTNLTADRVLEAEPYQSPPGGFTTSPRPVRQKNISLLSMLLKPWTFWTVYMKDKPLIVKLVVGVVGFFIVITLIGLTMETPTPPPTAQKASPVQKTYKSFLINEKVHDAPVKTQIEQFYVITGKPTKGQMEAFLKETYETLRARTGFKHHNNPTAIYIWLYESRAHYESGMGQHFARLSKSASDATYSIEVNDNLMPTPKKSETKPVVKKDTNPGLSESEKKQIYLDAVRCEDKAVKESGRNDSRTVEEIERTNAIREKLDAECKIALAKNLDITIEQIKEISIEGVAENWPFPEQE